MTRTPTIKRGHATGSPSRRRLRLTYDDYAAMTPEGGGYELIDGELVMVPAPGTPHQAVVGELCRLLSNFVTRTKRGQVFIAPFDVVLSRHDTVQPDLLFVATARRSIITDANVQGAPDWVAEIASPFGRARDRGVKMRLYARHGVREYWIVDPAARSVEVHVLDDDGEFALKQRAVGKGRVRSTVIPGFAVSVKQVFED